jgi:hypothetical protein
MRNRKFVAPKINSSIDEGFHDQTIPLNSLSLHTKAAA